MLTCSAWPNELPDVRFESPFILIGKSIMDFNRSIIARSQILVNRKRSGTRIWALFRKRTEPECSFVCGADQVGQQYCSVFFLMMSMMGFSIFVNFLTIPDPLR